MTTDHLYELHTAIIAALAADSTLQAMINGVYGNVPSDAKFPFVAVDNLVASYNSSRTTNGWHIQITVKTFSRTRSNQ